MRHDSSCVRARGAATGASNEEVGSDRTLPAQTLDGEFRAAGVPAGDAMTDDGDSEDSGVFVFRGIDADETVRAIALLRDVGAEVRALNVACDGDVGASLSLLRQ